MKIINNIKQRFYSWRFKYRIEKQIREERRRALQLSKELDALFADPTFMFSNMPCYKNSSPVIKRYKYTQDLLQFPYELTTHPLRYESQSNEHKDTRALSTYAFRESIKNL